MMKFNTVCGKNIFLRVPFFFQVGERNAVVFDLSNASGTVVDVPDDFFDLTLDDARQLLRDHKRRQ